MSVPHPHVPFLDPGHIIPPSNLRPIHLRARPPIYRPASPQSNLRPLTLPLFFFLLLLLLLLKRLPGPPGPCCLQIHETSVSESVIPNQYPKTRTPVDSYTTELRNNIIILTKSIQKKGNILESQKQNPCSLCLHQTAVPTPSQFIRHRNENFIKLKTQQEPHPSTPANDSQVEHLHDAVLREQCVPPRPHPEPRLVAQVKLFPGTAKRIDFFPAVTVETVVVWSSPAGSK
ncbi:hypothetical protein NL676_022507 [Syzygium grande]|nr:hypothetical protein NL676_022507 [Syzygium grande]